ncbi:MAG: helix-turn-helix domain-containing protein [Eubacteriales bacterium]|nr:helix-turn-helix domain-containing protein [Eubacteriales bacterium]
MEFREQALHYCHTISALTGVCCTLLDVASNQFCRRAFCNTCTRCDSQICDAVQVHQSSCKEAQRWNGHYRYHCPCGLLFIATSLRRPRLQSELAMVTGPFLLPEDAGDCQDGIPVLTEERIRALDETIQAICGYLAGGQMMSAVDFSIQVEMLETMHLSQQNESRISYPLENERQLQQLIRLGNKQKAQQLLNEMLLELYSAVGTDLFLLKLRIRELITLMSRAAADGGADVNAIFALCDSSVMEIDRIQDFDTLDAWLGVMLHKFFDMVFDFNDAKHQSIIQQVSSFIQEHLAEKLTLEQVAGQVHLSKSYLCRILKDELGCTFTEYTNRLRVERSKLYLHRSGMSLSEIACAVGFDDQSYFTRIFKRQVGVPPGKYRANHAGYSIQ